LTTVMSSRSMKVATETAIKVHHLRAMSFSFCACRAWGGRHIGRVWFVTPMTDPNERT
jgi:hypothetical protein